MSFQVLPLIVDELSIVVALLTSELCTWTESTVSCGPPPGPQYVHTYSRVICFLAILENATRTFHAPLSFQHTSKIGS